jgi:uncharacterized SAM-binding protein YcdF (DUF218 family)
MLDHRTTAQPRRISRFGAQFVALCAVLLSAGFVCFAWLVPNQQAVLDRDADGIVVLTGGTSRISDALELLAASRGKRLLITGVNRGTTTVGIAREYPKFDSLITCCVDLDHSAMNTRDNAIQSRLWAERHGFHSLILVTSAYHMPRAFAELAHQLPARALVPFPVVTERMRLEPWWSSGATTKLVLSEYLKYLFAELRMRFDSLAPDRSGNQTSASRRS